MEWNETDVLQALIRWMGIFIIHVYVLFSEWQVLGSLELRSLNELLFRPGVGYIPQEIHLESAYCNTQL